MENNKITYKNIVKILDERFKKKNILYDHLHMSYNDYLKKVSIALYENFKRINTSESISDIFNRFLMHESEN